MTDGKRARIDHDNRICDEARRLLGLDIAPDSMAGVANNLDVLAGHAATIRATLDRVAVGKRR